jgi:membrane-associated phospholipid phosphatase
MNAHQGSGWRPRALLACHVAIVLIVGSWLLPATRAWWDALDESVFRALNGSLESGESWQTFWAWANWRMADAVPALFMLALVVWWLIEGGRKVLGRRIAAFVAFAFALLLMRDLTGTLLEDGMEWRRRSPTLLLPDVFLLSTLVPHVDAKDISGKSFPGDHAFALIAVAVFLWHQAGKRRGLFALLILTPFMLPRLVGGAHWLTDILVGSVCMVLFVSSWWFSTPLGARATDLAHAVVRRPLALLRLDTSHQRPRTHTT